MKKLLIALTLVFSLTVHQNAQSLALNLTTTTTTTVLGGIAFGGIIFGGATALTGSAMKSDTVAKIGFAMFVIGFFIAPAVMLALDGDPEAEETDLAPLTPERAEELGLEDFEVSSYEDTREADSDILRELSTFVEYDENGNAQEAVAADHPEALELMKLMNPTTRKILWGTSEIPQI